MKKDKIPTGDKIKRFLANEYIADFMDNQNSYTAYKVSADKSNTGGARDAAKAYREWYDKKYKGKR